MRTITSQHISNPQEFKVQLLQWSQQFDEVVWLDSNDYDDTYVYDAVLAVEALTIFQTDSFQVFDQLKEYQSTTKDWLFGYLSYDLKNDTEDLTSNNYDGLDFPELFFFQPKKLFILRGNKLETHYLHFVADELSADLNAIESIQKSLKSETEDKQIRINCVSIKMTISIR